MPASRRREAMTSALASSFGNATPTSPISPHRSARERDDVLLLVGIVARDDRDAGLVVRILGVVRDAGRDKQEVAGTGLEGELEGVPPVVNRAAADDVDRALELAVGVGLRAGVRRHDDQVEREGLRARRLSRHTEVIRDLLLRLERLQRADADASVVARDVDLAVAHAAVATAPRPLSFAMDR